jgi:hypothetical protein
MTREESRDECDYGTFLELKTALGSMDFKAAGDPYHNLPAGRQGLTGRSWCACFEQARIGQFHLLDREDKTLGTLN